MSQDNQWSFLTSPRFWALVIGAVALALYTDHHISQAWFICIGTITGGFVAVRTVDRFGEQIGSVKNQQINVNQPKESNDDSEV